VVVTIRIKSLNKMNLEIKVRKPSNLRWCVKFIFGKFSRWNTKWFEWQLRLPNEGDRIIITWFPPNLGTQNAYIGWKGVVKKLNKREGTFCLDSGNAILICHGNFNYIKL